jgi:hypothetical protein
MDVKNPPTYIVYPIEPNSIDSLGPKEQTNGLANMKDVIA